MYNIFINIVGWIAIVWFLLLVFWHIVVYIYMKIYDGDNSYVAVKRDSYLCSSEFGNFYILPTISLNLKGKYKEVEICWLLWVFSLSYHIVNEKEDSIEGQLRHKIETDESSSV